MPDNQGGSVIKQTMFFSLVLHPLFNGGYLVGATRESAYTRRRASVISATWQWTFLCMTPCTHLPDPGRPTTCTRPTRCTLPTRLYATLMQFLKYLQRACKGRWICTRREMTVKRARIERIRLKLFGHRRDGDAERSEGECVDWVRRDWYIGISEIW